MSVRSAVVFAAAAVVFSIGCGSSYSPAPAPTPNPNPNPTPSGSTTMASIVRGAIGLTTTAYSPNPINVAVGGSVTWTNDDTIAHTSTSAGNWDSGTIAPGGSFTKTFQTAGSFSYICSIHPNMVGTVNVQ